MSSPNQQPGRCDAVVSLQNRPRGPVRLPIRDARSFVEQFNRIYLNIGLELSPIMTLTSDALRQKKCLPCEGGVPTIEPAEASNMMAVIPNWNLDVAGKLISRKINAGNFVKAIALIGKIADLAEAEMHHPDLHLTGYRHLQIDLTTHAIGGLSENDFIVAAKVDELLG